MSNTLEEIPIDDTKEKPMLLDLLESVIKADLVDTIMNMPHLTMAERKIALGRALRRGMVEDMMRELVQEEVALSALDHGEISDALAEALLTTSPAIPE